MNERISRGLKLVFWADVIICGLSNLCGLLIPEAFAGVLGITTREPAMLRLIGAAGLALTAGPLFALRETAWHRVKIVVQMHVVWTVLGAVVFAWGALFAGLPAGVWGLVLLFAVFAVAFVVFYIRQERAIQPGPVAYTHQHGLP